MTAARQVPAAPTIPSNRELGLWAIAVTNFLRAISGSAITPTSVLFETWTSVAKAIDSGLVMYDPTNATLMVSVDGVWEPVALRSDFEARIAALEAVVIP